MNSKFLNAMRIDGIGMLAVWILGFLLGLVVGVTALALMTNN